MNKLYSTLCALAFGGMLAGAQQLPNVGFADWKSACGSSDAVGEMRTRPGSEPASWNGSSVNQKVSGVTKEETLITKADDNSAVLTGKYVGVNLGLIKIGSVAPGFITLGTPWVYAEATTSNCDGGVYGGIAFTGQPDALRLDVNREDNNDEDSYIIAYTWKGTFKSKVGKKGAPTSSRDDVDRAIMGRTTPDEAGTLVASLEKTFRNTGGKQTYTIPFTYASAEAPEKANVIVSAGDYWNRGNLKENTSATVNNICFIYYSQLGDLSYNGTTLAGFTPGKYDYEVDEFLPAGTAAFGYTALGRTAKVTPAINADDRTVTFTVANTGADTDGLAQHVYTVKFTKVETTTYDGLLNIVMGGQSLNNGGQNATISLANTSATTCTFTLPDFAIDLGEGPIPLGDIVVSNVSVTETAGVKTYVGHVSDMELADGALVCDVDLNGTITAAGDVNMTINVGWKYDDAIIPIDVTFTNATMQEIEGKLYIKMGGEYLNPDGQSAKVQILSGSDKSVCTFRLPEFALDLGDGPIALGDIEVPDARVSEAAGVSTYTGHVSDMQLAQGAIVADVDLGGTVTAQGVANLTINVGWKFEGQIIPIEVIFTNDPAYTAIESVEVARGDAAAVYYTLRGVRVDAESLTPGIYVVSRGGTVGKVLVK